MRNSEILASELYWQNDAFSRELAEDQHEALQMLDFELEPDPVRRRSPIEEPCCQHSQGFMAIPSLQRDLDTGYLEGTFYRCQSCCTVICEEDYAALCEYSERRLKLVELMEREPVPAEFEIPVRAPGKVA